MIKKYSNLSFENQVINGVQFNLDNNCVIVNGTATGPINFNIGTVENMISGINYRLTGAYNIPNMLYASVDGNQYYDPGMINPESNRYGISFPTENQNGVLGVTIPEGMTFNNRKLYPEVIKNSFWENSNLKTILDETLTDICDAIRYAGRFNEVFKAKLIPTYIEQFNTYLPSDLNGLYVLKLGNNGQFCNLFRKYNIPDRNNYLNDLLYNEEKLFDVSNMFTEATNVGNIAFMTNNIQNMSHMYDNCRSFNGSPVCGINVTDMSWAYRGCINLTGSPACGDKVVNMTNAYANCNKLTGSPVCGDNVVNMANTYFNCRNLTGSPVCGDKVVNMTNAYANCNKLTGSPACGDNVYNMAYAYNNCHNLTGSPACGDNVYNMAYAYNNCHNLTGSPVCGNKVVDMANTYFNCRNLTGSPVCGDNVTDMSWAYRECFNLTGSPVCGNKVVNMSFAYRDCNNLTGSPVCGNNVINMTNTYLNCRNLTGSPVCGNKVVDMVYAYANCNNLTGSPVCGDTVYNMAYAYFNCYNLTGYPVCGNAVLDMRYAYLNCRNLLNVMVIGSSVYDAAYAYYNIGDRTKFNEAIGYFVQHVGCLNNIYGLLGYYNDSNRKIDKLTFIVKNINSTIPDLFKYIYADMSLTLKKANTTLNNLSFQYQNKNVTSYFGENPEMYYGNLNKVGVGMCEVFIYKEVYNYVTSSE